VSDFLVNLARRSAGLAPVVRARPILDAMDGDEQAPVRAADELPITVAPMSRHLAAATPAGVPTRDTPFGGPATMRVAAPSASVPTPARVARRAATAAAAPLPSAAGASPMASDAARRGAYASAPSSVLHVSASAPSEPREAIVGEQAPRATRNEPPPQELRIESAAVPSDAPAPVAVSLEPAVSTRAAASARAEPAPERTVHVRIGAIEIHGADAAPSAPATAAPVAAERTTNAAPVSGFDDYAALRSYAPWNW